MNTVDSWPVFLHNDVLDADSVGTVLAPGVMATFGYAVASMLFRSGLISANAARRLRNASVIYSPTMMASPFIVQLVGSLAGSVLQLLQASLAPYGVSVGFLVVSMVMNQIYVYDDLLFDPVRVQPSMLVPFHGDSKFWLIQKRPESTAAVFKRVVQAVQKKMNRGSAASRTQQVPVVALTSKKQQQKDEALTNFVLAAMFVIASVFYAWQARNEKMMRFELRNTASFIPRQLSLAAPLARKQVPRKAERTQVARKLGQQTAGRWALRIAPLTPRMRWAIFTTALIGLQLSHQPAPEGWLTGADVEEE